MIIDNHKRSHTDHVQIYRILPELEQFCPPTSMQLLSTNNTSDDESLAITKQILHSICAQSVYSQDPCTI